MVLFKFDFMLIAYPQKNLVVCIENEIFFRIAYLESTKRGWTTYTDVCVLSKSAVLKRCWLLIYDGVIKVGSSLIKKKSQKFHGHLKHFVIMRLCIV